MNSALTYIGGALSGYYSIRSIIEDPDATGDFFESVNELLDEDEPEWMEAIEPLQDAYSENDQFARYLKKTGISGLLLGAGIYLDGEIQ